MQYVSTLVLGQGFAGTAVAWRLVQQGKSFAIVDRGDPHSCSAVAAGPVTPITGLRAVLTEAWEDAWPVAVQFYQEIETLTQTSFWYTQPSVRFFVSESERSQVEHRFLQHDSSLAQPYVEALLAEKHPKAVQTLAPILDGHRYRIEYGGVLMPTAAKLDAPRYLQASRAFFDELGAYRCKQIDLKNDLRWTDSSIEIPSLNLSADRIIFCQGFEQIHSPISEQLPLVPAQGDILTLAIPGLNEQRVVHHGVWLSRIDSQSDLYRVGSTYQWDKLDRQPSQSARESILQRLNAFPRLPYQVVDHQAGIRPTSFDRKPLIGQLPSHPSAWIFNGLGAKGTLLAPWCSGLIAAQLDHPTTLASNGRHEFHWNRKSHRAVDKDTAIKNDRLLKYQEALKKNHPPSQTDK